MADISTIRAHIPPDIFTANVNADGFVKILDGMQEVRLEELDRYLRRFYYPLVTDIKLLRRYVDEWAAEYLETSTELCLDCLYRNFANIYRKKGTTEALEQLLECLFTVNSDVPTVTVTGYSWGMPLILLEDDRAFDWLPEGEDIAAELYPLYGYAPLYCPTLLTEGWEYTHTLLSITVDCGYTPSPRFLAYIRKIILLYLPMANPNFLDISITIV